ncbi:cuticle protein 2-like [Pieris rapae]|uniref:cuticle protein 2-like n=1 Tax=Pieris rapae TaxID=64459 RepID=UPI001E280374|nr:cuticle protein 2-like [Pieris rapae]
MYKSVVLFCVLAAAAAKPTLVAPVAYSNVAPVAYSAVAPEVYNIAPVAYSAVSPVAYSSVVSPAVSSVSQHSSSVVHGSPAVSAVYGASYAPVVPAYTTLAQAPGSPAVVLDPVHGVPLDTPEVVAARVAHYQAKALY